MDPLQENLAEIYKRTWRVLYLVSNELERADISLCLEKVKKMLTLLDDLLGALRSIKDIAKRNIPIETVEVIVRLSRKIVRTLEERLKSEHTNAAADGVEEEDEFVYDISTLFKIVEFHVDTAMQDIRIGTGESGLDAELIEGEVGSKPNFELEHVEATGLDDTIKCKEAEVAVVENKAQERETVYVVKSEEDTLLNNEAGTDIEVEVTETLGNEALDGNAAKGEIDNEILDAERAEEQEAQEEEVLEEDAPEGEVLEEDAPDEVVLEEDAPDEEVLEEDAPDEVVLEEEAPDEVVLEEDSPGSEEIEEEADEENREPKRAMLKYLPIIIYVKSSGDRVAPIDSTVLFQSEKIQIPDLTDTYQDYVRLIHRFVYTVPEGERSEHFEAVDRWQAIPDFMKLHFNSDLFTMDAGRIFEALVAGNEQLFPVLNTAATTDDTYNISIICPPSGGAVAGMTTFLNVNNGNLKVDWTAFTMHPWKETIEIDYVVCPDHILHQEPQKWKFVLNDDMDLVRKEDVRALVRQVRMEFPDKVNLVIADLSPSLIDIESGTTGLQFIEQVKTALFTEAGEIEVALNTLKDGGSLLLTMVNPVDHGSSLGNVGFLCGLFSAVTVIIPRSSSTWLKPVNVLFSGYLGFETFQNNYPNFSDQYISLIALNTVGGNNVMLDISTLPNAVKQAIVKMGKEWIKEESSRYNYLVGTFDNNFLSTEELNKEKLELAGKCILELQNYIVCGDPRDEVPKKVPQCCDKEELKLVKKLDRTEMQNILVGNVGPILTRLRGSYFDQEGNTVEFMNVLINSVNTLNWETVVREAFDFSSSFSRFASIKVMYDYMIARFLGSKFPITGYSQKIGSAIKNPCICHAKRKLLLVFASDKFQLKVEGKLLHVLCAHIPAAERSQMSDGDFHKTMCDMILTELHKRDRRDSLYVCRLPITSRLLLGIVCLLTNCFDETRLVIDQASKTVGVFLRNFKGQNNTKVKMNLEKLQVLKNDLDGDRPVNMEIVPISTMMTSIDLENFIRYNNAVGVEEIRAIVNVLVSALNENRTEGELRE